MGTIGTMGTVGTMGGKWKSFSNNFDGGRKISTRNYGKY